MIAASTKRNAGMAPGGFGKATTDKTNDTLVPYGMQRSAVNWFLDAACYAMDGDVPNARLAAVHALTAMRRER